MLYSCCPLINLKNKNLLFILLALCSYLRFVAAARVRVGETRNLYSMEDQRSDSSEMVSGGSGNIVQEASRSGSRVDPKHIIFAAKEMVSSMLERHRKNRERKDELPRFTSRSIQRFRKPIFHKGDGGDTTKGSDKMARSGELSERFPRADIVRRPSNEDLKERLRLWSGSVRFSLEQLRTATLNFSLTRQISINFFEKRYAGDLQGERVVVVRFMSPDKEARFLSEVEALSMLRHPNILRGIGWCHEEGEFFIVHEAMDNGTLSDHLFRTLRESLPWDVRFKIVLDLASAILYLHEQCEKCILHRDITPGNVLLDSDFNAKLASFEFSKTIGHGAEVMGAPSYRDPEYARTGVLSAGSDVYSFGLVVLQIASGRHGIISKLSSLRLLDEEEISAIADVRLSGEFDPEQMKALITIGIQCTRQNPNTRPTIQEVVQFLKFGVALPDKEMEVPSPTRYSSPSSQMHPLAVTDVGEGLLDSSKVTHVIGPSEINEKPIVAEETLNKTEQPVLEAERSLTRETFDIGIPSGYHERGPLHDSQVRFMKGFLAALHENLKSGMLFTDVLEVTRSFTSTLVTLHTPLRDWDSFAQRVLADVQRTEALRGKLGGVELQRAERLSSLCAQFEIFLATINEDRENSASTEQERASSMSKLDAKMDESKEKLASGEQEHESSMINLDDLQKEHAELHNQTEGVEGTSDLSEDSKRIIHSPSTHSTESIERIEYIEYAILTLHESLISRVSSFADSITSSPPTIPSSSTLPSTTSLTFSLSPPMLPAHSRPPMYHFDPPP